MTRPRLARAQAIAVWRDNLIDLDAVLDDKRQVFEEALNELRLAAFERDRAARHLSHLIEWDRAARPAATRRQAQAS